MAPNLTQIKIQKVGSPALHKALKIICAKFGAVAMSPSMRKIAKIEIFFAANLI